MLSTNEREGDVVFPGLRYTAFTMYKDVVRVLPSVQPTSCLYAGAKIL